MDDFTAWCRSTAFTDAMVRASALLQRACDLHLAGLYRSLEMESLLREPATAASVAERLGFVDTADITLGAMLQRLASRGDVVRIRHADSALLYEHAVTPEEPSGELAEIRRELETLGDGYVAGLEFLDFGSEHFVQALRDDPDLLDRMLSGREAGLAGLWDRATNDDPLQDVHGLMGARFLADLDGWSEILEIGGGTGNGIRHLFRMLDGRGDLDRVGRYVFTDISQRFVLTTRHSVRASFPAVPCEWRFLDINEAFAKQRVPAASIDLIYGVNAAHVARDIVGFLEESSERGAALYSIGYTPDDHPDGSLHALRLKVKGRGLKVRHRRSYVTSSVSSQLADRAVGAATLGWIDNPHGIKAEIAEQVQAEDGNWNVTVLLTIPIRDLGLVEANGVHQTSCRVALLVVTESGGLTRPQYIEIPLQITESQLEEARKQVFGARANLRLPPGSHQLAVGLWDEIGGKGSYIASPIVVGQG